jgi:hypothetical protein
MERDLEDRLYLEEALTLFEPPERLPNLVADVREIYSRRHFLKQLPFDEGAIAYLAGVVRRALHSSQRFRVFDCLKVLRAIVVKGNGQRLSPTTVRDLFAIYRRLILSAREEMQWCLSRLVKDQELDDADVSWLLSHWEESEHLVNRLLLYPGRHPAIEAWARERYARAELDDRKSELIARLLEADDLAAFRNEDPETLGWAVFRSRRTIEDKVSLFTTLVPRLQGATIVDFALRLDAPELIREALKEGPANRAAAGAGHPGGIH